MSVFYELIDRTSGNVIKDYESEAAALYELEAVVRAYGFDEIRDFALLRFQDGLPTRAVLEDDLIALVKATDPQYWGVKTATTISLLSNKRKHRTFELQLEPAMAATITTASIAYEASPIQWPGKPPLPVHQTDELTSTKRMDLVCVA